MEVRALIVLFIAVFTTILGIGIIVPFIPKYAETMGANGVWIGVIFAAFPLARVATMPIFGRLSDLSSRRWFIVAGIFFYAIVSIAYIYATNVFSLVMVRFLNGLASAMVIPVAMAYVGEIAPPDEVGKYMGTFGMAMFLGMGAGPLVGGVINDLFDMNASFYAMFFLSSIAFIVSLLFLPDVARKRGDVNNHKTPWRKMFKKDIVKAILLFRLINALGRGGIMAFLPLFASSLSISPGYIGAVIASHIILTGIPQRSFGMLADRYNKVFLIATGSIIGALALAVMPFCSDFKELLTASVLMGMGGALAMPAATSIAVDIGYDYGMGVSMGFFNMAMSLGMIAAPLISGLIMDTMGISKVFFVASALSFVGTGVFIYFAKREGLGAPNAEIVKNK
ncbi:MAG: MFS transporter [Myxococcota bacterium]